MVEKATPNRTILELKYVLDRYKHLSGKTPNRTILELKYFFAYLALERGITPNRTILELKYRFDISNVFLKFLLIVPFWN